MRYPYGHEALCETPWRERLLALLVLLVVLSAASVQVRAAGLDPGVDVKALLAGKDTVKQLAWAVRYENGEGVTKDPDKAVELYCRAAQAGSADAEYALGWMYANGRGVARDERLAAAWFRKGAAQGDRYSKRMLGFLGDVGSARARCLLSDGRVYTGHPRLHSVAQPSRKQIARWVATLAPRYKLQPSLVLAVIRVESDFDPQALSPKNAQGLMQLLPGTAARFGVKDVWDPLQNLKGGMAYLRWLLDFFDGNEHLALAGYNAGEGAVLEHGGIPPFAETRSYVERVNAWRQLTPARLIGSG